MSPEKRIKERLVVKPKETIPYSRILEALKSGWQVCTEIKKACPTRIALFLNRSDRAVREPHESMFLDELTRDLVCFIDDQNSETTLGEIGIEIQTESRFLPGRFRIEYILNDLVLHRVEQDKDAVYCSGDKARQTEWRGVDILTKTDDHSKTILVVDDEPVLCASLGMTISRLGYSAVCAHDGLEAVKILPEMNFDMVITDLHMPKMDGWTLMRYIKKEIPGMPVILITGYHSDHNKDEASRSAADGYISKPFSADQIRNILESVFKQKAGSNTTITYI